VISLSGVDLIYAEEISDRRKEEVAAATSADTQAYPVTRP
jgi:hypothetical protein